jgi:hypothetical protein
VVRHAVSQAMRAVIMRVTSASVSAVDVFVIFPI